MADGRVMEPGWNSETRMLFLFFTSSSSVVVQRSSLAYVKCSMINCSFFQTLMCRYRCDIAKTGFLVEIISILIL